MKFAPLIATSASELVMGAATEHVRASAASDATSGPEARAVSGRAMGVATRAREDAGAVDRPTFAGCEGTHGVFPACDFACKPCYHSADANKVRDRRAAHARRGGRQMAFLRVRRGVRRQHAQLIGGEVTLLPPDDHAAALEAMRRHGRHADEHDPRRLRRRLPPAAGAATPTARAGSVGVVRGPHRLDDARPHRGRAPGDRRRSCNRHRARSARCSTGSAASTACVRTWPTT